MIPGLGHRGYLGVSVGDRSLVVAQAHGSRAGARVGKTGVFVFPDGVDWSKHAELGAAFAKFLKAGGFGGKPVVWGLPAHWTLTEFKTLPDADAQTVQSVLRLMIERDYQPEGKDWSFDFIRCSRNEGRLGIALGATSMQRLAQVQQLASAAGLKTVAVTSTLATMFRGLPVDSVKPLLALHLRADGVEAGVMTWQGLRGCEWLFSGKPEQAHGPMIAGELRRFVARHLPATPLSGIDVVVFNACMLDRDDVTRLLDQAGLVSREGAAQTAGNAGDGTASTAGFAGRLSFRASPQMAYSASVALAESKLGSGGNETFDFSASRLLIDTAGIARRRRMSIAALVLLMAGLVGYAAVDWYQQQQELEVMTAELVGMKESLTLAQSRIDRLEKARGWLDKRPAMLDQLRALTLAMPTVGQVWTTSVSIREDRTGTLVGKALTEKGVIDLLDKLRATGRFTDVKLLYLRQADRTGRSVSFALTFTFKGQE